MIKLKNVSYCVADENNNTREILSNLNVEFQSGKITVITGQNGSGKSTLIKLLMGIISASKGNIYLDDVDITNLSVTERAKLGMTMAFQQPVRFKGLSVRDLMSIATKKDTNLTNLCQNLAKVGLCAKDYIDRELDDTLSGGEIKRIEIAIAIAKGGEVYLFDEPEAGIDLWSFDNLTDIFKNLKGKTIIIVSHQKKILDIADNILLLDNNGNAKIGAKSEMLALLNKPHCAVLGGGVNEQN